MPILIYLFLYGWVLVTLAAFALRGPRAAISFSFVGGMILLPAFAIQVPGLPGAFDRIAAVVLPCVIGVVLMDARSLVGGRMVATDWAMLAFTLVPIPTSLSNDLGLYDGVATCYRQALVFGFPYLFGRIYFKGDNGLKAAVVAIAVGGILLAPIALWEIRMSPRLHSQVFGKTAVRFMMFARFGGFRPIAFFPSPLMLTFALAAATVCAVWLGHTKRSSNFYGVRYLHWAILLAVATILGKTFGAITLMLGGCALLWIVARTRRKELLVLVAGFVFLYPALRLSQVLPAETIISIIEPIFPEEKVQSLTYRVTQEDLFAEHAFERPWFGWGGWGRNRTAETKAIDGLWIAMFSKHGFVGVVALLLCFAIPVFRTIRRIPRGGWSRPENAPAAAMMMVVILFWMDCLLNGFPNPLYFLGMGALAAWKPEQTPSPGFGASREDPAESEEVRPPTPGPRFIDLKRRTAVRGHR